MTPLKSDRGFSMIETMFVTGLMGVIASIALLQMGNSRPALKGDGGMRVVLAQMNQAREQAITQRHFMRMVFTAPNQLQVVREDTPTTTTVLSTALIEGGVQYAVISGLPDTPDSFGMSSAISFGSATNVKFAPDGTLVNQDGRTTNGGVFVAWQNIALSARAVTVLGSTGRVRGYRWDGRAWKLVS